MDQKSNEGLDHDTQLELKLYNVKPCQWKGLMKFDDKWSIHKTWMKLWWIDTDNLIVAFIGNSPPAEEGTKSWGGHSE